MVQESSKFVKDKDSETKKVTFAPFDVSRLHFIYLFIFEHHKSKMIEKMEVLAASCRLSRQFPRVSKDIYIVWYYDIYG